MDFCTACVMPMTWDFWVASLGSMSSCQARNHNTPTGCGNNFHTSNTQFWELHLLYVFTPSYLMWFVCVLYVFLVFLLCVCVRACVRARACVCVMMCFWHMEAQKNHFTTCVWHIGVHKCHFMMCFGHCSLQKCRTSCSKEPSPGFWNAAGVRGEAGSHQKISILKSESYHARSMFRES